MRGLSQYAIYNTEIVMRENQSSPVKPNAKAYNSLQHSLECRMKALHCAQLSTIAVMKIKNHMKKLEQ